MADFNMKFKKIRVHFWDVRFVLLKVFEGYAKVYTWLHNSFFYIDGKFTTVLAGSFQLVN